MMKIGEMIPVNRDIIVTCSHHLSIRLEVGASYSMPLTRQVSISYPRVSHGSFLCPVMGIFYSFIIFLLYYSNSKDSFSFLPDIDRCIHIPVHPVSARTDICPVR